MKNKFLSILVFACSAVFSCEKVNTHQDESTPQAMILGEWQCIKSSTTAIYELTGEERHYEESYLDKDIYLLFDDDRNGKKIQGSKTTPFTYTLTKDSLVYVTPRAYSDALHRFRFGYALESFKNKSLVLKSDFSAFEGTSHGIKTTEYAYFEKISKEE